MTTGDTRIAVPPGAWTKIHGTGLEVYSYADGNVFIGVDEIGCLWVCHDPEWYPVSTLVIRKEIR
jgi:hypothetical protein